LLHLPIQHLQLLGIVLERHLHLLLAFTFLSFWILVS
jgi:hypothetical protein